MRNDIGVIILAFLLILGEGCTFPGDNKKSTKKDTPKYTSTVNKSDDHKTPSDLIPQGHKIFEKAAGDINKDGVADSIFMVKGTKEDAIIEDEMRGVLDRNRRGIMIFVNNNGHFELVTKNIDCFSSENEDGGIYYQPELSVSLTKGNLYIHYAHGRYGFWKYTFRFKGSDFELIGYDSSENYGPVINSETSINYLTKKKLKRVNVNENAESGDEVFEDTWTKVEITHLIKLSEIKDFDELEVL